VLELKEYFQRSNDKELIKSLNKRVFDLVNYFKKFENKDGLLENLDGSVFVDASKANDFTKGVSYPTNMIYAEMLDAVGKLYAKPKFIDKAKKIREIIRKQSFNGEFFIDNAVRDNNGKLNLTKNISEACQYYAFYFHIADVHTYPGLWKIMLEKFGLNRNDKEVFPNVYKAELLVGVMLRLELLSRFERKQDLVNEIKDYFYSMTKLTGTFWEHYSDDGSYNHGYTSYAACLILQNVLGLKYIDPCKKEIEIEFSDSKIKNCKGAIPVGDDIVALNWRKDENSIHYSLNIPEGYRVKIFNESGLKLLRNYCLIKLYK
jgi:alpha-L-rhamnosidase